MRRHKCFGHTISPNPDTYISRQFILIFGPIFREDFFFFLVKRILYHGYFSQDTWGRQMAGLQSYVRTFLRDVPEFEARLRHSLSGSEEDWDVHTYRAKRGEINRC